ncbi:MAG: hypothetical protein PHR98_02805 [Candidatus Shapirobacteria bacterium]|nr:hypothetical protein [Candidatus Shapirobacteria bacterium]
MDPRKSNARRGFKEREEIRRKNASQWQPEFSNTQKEGEMNENWKSITIVGLVCLTVLCLGACIISSYAGNIFSRPATVTKAPTAEVPVVNEPVVNEPVIEAPVVVATEALVVETTEEPVVETTEESVVETTEEAVSTETPVIPTEASVVVILPTNPSIEGKLDTITQQGENLDTILGKRITFTCRKIVVPNKVWNENLTAEELKAIETTWVSYKLNVPEGFFARVFAGGIRQGTTLYNEGILMTLKPGSYEFDLRNGEIVLWYPEQDKFEQNDLVRIFDQIRNGNFDIHSELAFFATTTDLLPKIPADLVQKNNVQIVPSLDPTTK